MKTAKAILVWAMLCMGLIFHSESLGAFMNFLDETNSQPSNVNQSFERLRYSVLNDSVAGSEENYGYTAPPLYDPLEVHPGSTPGSYEAYSPYYKVTLTSTSFRMSVGNAWIECGFVNQELGEIDSATPVCEKNSLSVPVFDSVNAAYTVDSSVLTELLTLEEWKEFSRIIQTFTD